jgi:hypothetical protein
MDWLYQQTGHPLNGVYFILFLRKFAKNIIKE